MPNLAQSLKAEITRISRKEIKSSIIPLHHANVALKKTVAELKKRIAALESGNKPLSPSGKAAPERPGEALTEAAGKARITARSIKSLREKLDLSQDQFAKLIGISRQNVFVMEHKQGRLKVRKATLANILSIKDIGKREAKARLAAAGDGGELDNE
jgi:DNA-binding transcriptional regulator YiaG